MTGQGHPKLAMMHVSFFGAVSGGFQEAEQVAPGQPQPAFGLAGRLGFDGDFLVGMVLGC